MKKAALVLCFWVVASAAFAQTISHRGTEFWLGFFQNWTTSEQYLYISGKPGTSIEITQPSNGLRTWHGSFKLNASGVYLLDLTTYQTEILHTDTERSGKGIKITADDPVAVYAANVGAVSSDAAMILPVQALGSFYHVLTYVSRNSSGSSQFGVLAVEDNTEVEITSTAQDTKGWLLPGVSKKFTFSKAGEMIQFKASDGGGVDFSGTQIRTVASRSKPGKKIAVFGSANFTMICTDSESNSSVSERGRKNTVSDDPGCGGGRDHQYEQIYPRNVASKEYITAPYLRRDFDIFKIMALSDSTRIEVDGKPLRNNAGASILLNRGDWYTLMLPNTDLAKKPLSHSFVGNYPFLLGQFASSKLAAKANPEQYGDPFFVLLNGKDQRVNQAQFYVFEGVGSGFVYYLNALVRTADIGKVLLDDKPVASSLFYTSQADPSFSFLRLENVTLGNHKLEAPQGFNGAVYGYSRDFESYGYNLGIAISQQVAFSASKNSPGARIEDGSQYCFVKGDTIQFRLQSKPLYYDKAVWDFGDGKTATGDSVGHVFAENKNYTVRVRLHHPVFAEDTLSAKTLITLSSEPHLKKISVSGILCTGSTINLSADATSADSDVRWDFDGDGVYDATGKKVSYTLPQISQPVTVFCQAFNTQGCPAVLSKNLGVVGVSFSSQAIQIGNVLSVSRTTGVTYQWYFNGEVVPAAQGGTSNTLTVFENGEYKVLIKKDGCEVFSNAILFDRMTALGDPLASRLALYPNPASQTLNLSYEGAAAVRVLDVLGKEVAAFSFRDAYALDVSGFAKGVYLVEVIASEGTSIRRVVVE